MSVRTAEARAPAGATARTPSGTVARPSPRGSTTIAARVVAKIASEAANEVDHTTGHRHRLLGVRAGAGRPKAAAAVDGRLARISVEVGVDYPAPIPVVTRAVRARIVEQVGTLAGVDAREVDVTVSALIVADTRTPRVL